MEPSFSAVSIGLLNPLLHLLVKSGKIESIMKVLGWIEEAGIQPSNGMYCDVFSFAQKSGATYASIIEERVGSLRILIWERSLEKQGVSLPSLPSCIQMGKNYSPMAGESFL